MRRALPLVATCLALAGCLYPVAYIPYHAPTRGSRLGPDQESIEWLRTAPTREQVLLRLGEPDWATEEQRFFAYTWRASWGFILSGSSGELTGFRHFLFVEFDGDGKVRRIETKAQNADSWRR